MRLGVCLRAWSCIVEKVLGGRWDPAIAFSFRHDGFLEKKMVGGVSGRQKKMVGGVSGR